MENQKSNALITKYAIRNIKQEMVSDGGIL